MTDSNAFEHVKTLYEDKKLLFKDIKTITENASAAITAGNDEEVQADVYVSMVNKRESILEKIALIDQALKAPEYFEASCCTEFTSVKDEIKGIVKDIISMEERNKNEGARIKKAIAQKIKGLRAGKEASVAYNHDAFYSGISRFDSNN